MVIYTVPAATFVEPFPNTLILETKMAPQNNNLMSNRARCRTLEIYNLSTNKGRGREIGRRACVSCKDNVVLVRCAGLIGIKEAARVKLPPAKSGQDQPVLIITPMLSRYGIGSEITPDRRLGKQADVGCLPGRVCAHQEMMPRAFFLEHFHHKTPWECVVIKLNVSDNIQYSETRLWMCSDCEI